MYDYETEIKLIKFKEQIGYNVSMLHLTVQIIFMSILFVRLLNASK